MSKISTHDLSCIIEGDIPKRFKPSNEIKTTPKQIQEAMLEVKKRQGQELIQEVKELIIDKLLYSRHKKVDASGFIDMDMLENWAGVEGLKALAYILRNFETD